MSEKPATPSAQRLLQLPHDQLGFASPDLPRAVAGGVLLNHSGLPVLLPRPSAAVGA